MDIWVAIKLEHIEVARIESLTLEYAEYLEKQKEFGWVFASEPEKKYEWIPVYKLKPKVIEVALHDLSEKYKDKMNLRLSETEIVWITQIRNLPGPELIPDA